MNLEPKQKPSSKLRNLSEEQQEALFERMQGENNQSYPALCKYVEQEFHVPATKKILGSFYSWYSLRKSYAESEETRKLAIEERRRTHPDETEEALFAYGQQVFADDALNKRNINSWATVHKLRQGETNQKMALRRLELQTLDVAKAALARLPELNRIAGTSDLDEDAKIQAARILMFGDLAL